MFVCCSLSIECECREVKGGGGRGSREVFVSPSDNPCIDKTAATWSWNVNIILLSGSPHICLHPSTCLKPTLHYPHFYLFSLSLPLTLCFLFKFSLLKKTNKITRPLSPLRNIIFAPDVELLLHFLSGLFVQ